MASPEPGRTKVQPRSGHSVPSHWDNQSLQSIGTLKVFSQIGGSIIIQRSIVGFHTLRTSKKRVELKTRVQLPELLDTYFACL